MSSSPHEPHARFSLLTYAEAAEYLGIAEQTLRHWVSSGRVTFYKVGRYTRFSPADLDTFLEANRHPAVGQGGRR